MKKVLLFSSILFSFILFFSCSSVLATTNTATQAVKNTTEATKNVVMNVTSTTGNAMKNTVAASKPSTNTANSYEAQRTSTETTKVAGMTATGWAWFIVSILGILIIAMILFYAKQNNVSDQNNNKQE